jgi:hypothetical protein
MNIEGTQGMLRYKSLGKILILISLVFALSSCGNFGDNKKAQQECINGDCPCWQSQLTQYQEIKYDSKKVEETKQETTFYSSKDGIQVSTLYKDKKLACAYLIPEYNDFVPSYKLAISKCINYTKEECKGSEILDSYALEVFFTTHILAKAFPEGPSVATKAKITRNIEVKEPGSIEFRGTTLMIKPTWRATVSIQRIDKHKVKFKIEYTSSRKPGVLVLLGTWSNKPIHELPAFKDNLSDWQINTEINKKILSQKPKTVGQLKDLLIKQ